MGLDILLVAACALIDADGRVLLAKRPRDGRWRTVGVPRRQGGAGRDTGSGPDPRARGRAGDQVAPKCLAPFTFASHGYEAFHLLMPLYVCRTWEGEVTARQGQELVWVRAKRLADYAMPPADEPLKAMLRDLL